jgi:hypothetical protein
MAFSNIATLIQDCHYDCLILIHPQCQVIEATIKQLNEEGFETVEISRELSKSLMTVPMIERTRITDKWVLDYLTSFQPGPVVCAHPDLLFEPQLNVDPIALFRQAARITKLVILLLGDVSNDVLFYAAPGHKHYRTWRLSELLINQPNVVIQRIT